MNRCLGITSLMLASVLAACGATGSNQLAPPRKDLLGFLVDGDTTCNDLDHHLGSPNGRYESGRLITYRIAEDGQGRHSVFRGSDWSGAQYSLVVTCGSEGVVTHHSLVAVKAGT
jgi:hypothetical protein